MSEQNTLLSIEAQYIRIPKECPHRIRCLYERINVHEFEVEMGTWDEFIYYEEIQK